MHTLSMKTSIKTVQKCGSVNCSWTSLVAWSCLLFCWCTMIPCGVFVQILPSPCFKSSSPSKGGLPFPVGGYFVAAYIPMSQVFPSLNPHPVLLKVFPCSFWLNVTFKWLYAFITFPSVLKLSLQAFSWKNDPGRRFSSANLVGIAEELESKEWTWGKLVSKQDIYEREGAGLEILNREVGVLGWGTKNECVHWYEGMAFCGNVSCK